MPRSPIRPRSRGRELAAGAGATIALLALVAGLPLLLVWLSAGLFPHHVPSAHAIGSALLRKDDTGALFIRVVAVIGWLAWASFALSVIVEVVGRVRGRRTVRLPGLRTQQRWAGTLIAAILLMFPAPALANAAHSGPARPLAVAAAPVRPALAAQAADRPAAAPRVVITAPTYHVKPGDYLGSIAQRYEGSFDDYDALAKANHIDNPDLIHPGQSIKLPGSAYDRGERPHATGSIVNDEPPASPGPGAGAPSAPTQPPTHTSAPTHSPTAAPTTAPTQAPKPTHAPTHPATHAPTHPATHPPGNAPTQPAAHGPGTVDASAVHAADWSAALESVEVGGTLAAVVTLGLLAVRRREQLQRRLVKRVPTAATGGAVPRLMAPTRQVDVLRLDNALRALASIVDGWPVERIPQIAGVWLDFGAVTLLLADDSAPAPAPFVDDPNGWQLSASDRLPIDETHQAPLPTICTVGGRANQHLMLDIEYLRVLGIGGDPDESVNLLRFMAVELAHNVWSDEVRVVLSGFGDEAGTLSGIDPDRLRVQPSIPEAIARFRGRVAQASANWDGPADAPEILLVAHPEEADAGDLAALERDLMRAPGLGLAVVIAPTPAGFTAERYQVSVDRDGQLHVPFLGDAVMPSAALPSVLLPDVAELIGASRSGSESSPLDLARVTSRAIAEAAGGRTGTAAAMAGTHRRTAVLNRADLIRRTRSA